MVNTVFSSLGGIAGGLIMNIVKGIGVVVFAVALFYVTRWVQKNSKKQKSFTMYADILDMNGVLEFDKLAFTKSEDTGLLEMIFQDRKTDSIPPIPKHLIKNGHAVLLNYAPGHYAVIDTAATLRNLEKGINKYVLYNLGMKKYIIAKQREIMNRAESTKQKWEQRGPWIALGVTAILAILLAAFFFYFGTQMDSANIAQRTQECLNMGWRP